MSRVFLTFLAEPQLSDPPNSPADLLPQHTALFRQWLKASFSQNAAHNYYAHVKSVVMGMIELGLVRSYPDVYFPRNALTHGPRTAAAVALSESELERLVFALKRDIVNLHRGTFEASKVQEVTVYLLVLAIRTGGNPTPLLELTRDGLKPHLIPGMMRIDLVKHRAANTYHAALRGPQPVEGVLSIPMDGVAILTRVLENTAPLVSKASPSIKGRVWLYETDGRGAAGAIGCLTQAHIDKSIRSLVKRHDLKGDDGLTLTLNLSRLRKSKAHQLFKISGGDLAAVSALLGNSAAVVGQNYMNMTQTIRADGARFVGEILEDALSGGKSPAEGPNVKATPVGQCKDTLNGARAPKDGKTHCEQFVHCLGCPSFAIAGTLADLHRLFSFQRFLEAEVSYYPSDPEFDEWRDHRRSQITLIDEFTNRNFGAALTSDARSLAKSEPHSFWAVQLKILQRIQGLHG